MRSFDWAAIEPRKGQFTYTELAKAIDDCVNANVYMGLMIAVGPSSPDWIYTSGVLKVKVSGQNSNQASYYREGLKIPGGTLNVIGVIQGFLG
jgi:hypothetical protein